MNMFLDHCRFRDCQVTNEGCSGLAATLKSNQSHLKKLDLSGNKLGDLGEQKLADIEMDPRYKLEMLL